MKITRFHFRSSLDHFFIILLKYSYTRQLLNHKIGLGLLSVIAVSIIVPILNSYAVNDNFCSFTGGNSTDYQKCIKAFQDYQKMNRATDAAIQQNIAQNRNDTRHHDLEQNQTALHEWVMAKPILANNMAFGDLSQRSWYNTYMNDNLQIGRAHV